MPLPSPSWGAIESLLSAVVADECRHKHRSNCELVAQGLGNIGSVLFADTCHRRDCPHIGQYPPWRQDALFGNDPRSHAAPLDGALCPDGWKNPFGSPFAAVVHAITMSLPDGTTEVMRNAEAGCWIEARQELVQVIHPLAQRICIRRRRRIGDVTKY